ncbi:MAG: tryptophan synthase subunit alpha, partial [Micrococcales bacterium]|nr:tryptophan synthase subunit alpha [Micrococcales bacterium]
MASTANLIREIRANNQSVLIGYFPAGYPTLADSVEACLAMLDSGVDVLELGVPYSDPVMDGLVIQQATETALANGFKLSQVFEVIKRIKELSDKPVLVMSYWNPIIQYGVERFAKDLKESGAAGLITPDLIPDEAGQWLAVSDQLNLDRVFMATPSSSQQRLAKAAELSRGFVYACLLYTSDAADE